MLFPIRALRTRLLIFWCAPALSIFWPSQASAQASTKECIDSFRKNPTVLGIAPSDAEILVHEIAKSIGLDAEDITVISCEYVDKAYSYVSQGEANPIPEGEYIIYNPDWVREVIGTDKVQAIALFGHELGHILNRHFGANRNLAPREKEKEADHFAGCAVAKLGGDWTTLKGLLTRLRRDRDENYPDRLTSLETAEAGFKQCGGYVGNPDQVDRPLATAPTGPPTNSADNAFSSRGSTDDVDIAEGFRVSNQGDTFTRENDGSWVERPRHGQCCDYHFIESRRDTSYLYLYDASRKLTMRMPFKGGQALWTQNAGLTWNAWFSVTYQAATRRRGSIESAAGRTMNQSRPLLRDDIPVEFEERSNWDIGVTTCGYDSGYYQNLAAKLRQLNFTHLRPPEIYLHATDASYGIAANNQVFYYASTTQTAAVAISQYLIAALGVTFAPPVIGAGSGVDPTLRDKTIFVHLVGADCRKNPD